MYSEIREKILKYEKLFQVIHFFFTPIRIFKEFLVRRQMAIQLIECYSELKKSNKKIFYFGVPEHNNLGDMAQTYCTRQWLKSNYPNYKVVEIRTRISFDKKFLEFVKKILGENDIFIFQSGYCTRDKNPDHLMHINIMKRFPEQKAVILPQTVKLKSKKEIQKTKDIFSACNHLLFIARDNISYEQARHFVCTKQLELFPDIVTSLIGRAHKNLEKEGVLLCVRNDGEKFYSNEEIDDVIQQLKTVVSVVDKTDTNSRLGVWETYKNLENIIYEKVESFRKYKVIITDRYHGTIFSLVADTPVIVIKTNDHKVTSGVDWFKGVYEENSVRLADSLNEAVLYAKDVLAKEELIINDDYFYRTYYKERLKERIDIL